VQKLFRYLDYNRRYDRFSYSEQQMSKPRKTRSKLTV